MSWTADDMPDLSGKVIVVTGATSGIGLHAARAFAKNGAKVIMACQNKEKMAAVAQSICNEIPNAELEHMHVDLSDLDSVRNFAEEFTQRGFTVIDVLLLNAGIAYGPYFTSAQGYEKMFATNHLGHWLLTGLLLGFIKDNPGSRIISVSSLAHLGWSRIQYDVVRGENRAGYGEFSNYGQSKLANHWFIAALNRKLASAHAETIAVPAHPGCAVTGILDRHTGLWVAFFRRVQTFLLQSAEEGAYPLLMAATDPDITRQSHYGPTRMFETCGPAFSSARINKVVHDEALADELWRISEELCHFTYPI